MVEHPDQTPTKDREQNTPPGHPTVRYEHSHVRYRWVLYGAIIFGVLGILMHVALYFYFEWQLGRLSQKNQGTFPLAPYPSTELPAKPLLDPLERFGADTADRDFSGYEAMQERLHGYGDTSEKGYVHVPIEKAMEKLAGELPVRETRNEKTPRDNGLINDGEPNSGRLFRKVPE